ncbi:MAG TPA: di-heme-cytochrome C peroxidase [Polyangiaceae bacterium]|nr:di-heme-cytochrome C peroxidase [Polyangiaceae bacterium]
MTRGSMVLALALTCALAAQAGCKSEPTKEPEKTASQPPSSASPSAAPATTAAAGKEPLYLAALDAAERQDFYHVPEGGELLPLDILYAVESTKTFKPFMENLERFRLIPDPADPDGLPVGMSVAMVDGKRTDPRMVFFNCAACHVAEVTYQGARIRVDGAPAHFDMAGFVVELIESLTATITDPNRLSPFLHRLAKRRHPGSGDAAVTKAWPDLKLPADKPALALSAKAKELIESEKARVVEKIEQKKVELDTAAEALHLIKSKIVYLERIRGLKTTTFSGFGRLDAFMAARNLLFGEKYAVDVDSPVSLPPIFYLSKLTWFHYDNNTNSFLQRNIGQDLGVGAVADMNTGDSTVLLRNLRRLEQIASKLSTPRWPEEVLGKIDRERAGRGAEIYKKECASCHDYGDDGMFPDRTYDLATIGTDPNRANNFIKPLGDKTFVGELAVVLDKLEKAAFVREKVTPEEAAKMEPPKIIWRGTGKYASRPLAGVWASAPYLHNGSVPTLYDLLLPPEKRPKTFLTGSRELDTKKVGYETSGEKGGAFLFDTSQNANKNTGHTYGTTLSEEQRLDLIEHLKSL